MPAKTDIFLERAIALLVDVVLEKLQRVVGVAVDDEHADAPVAVMLTFQKSSNSDYCN